MFPFCLTTTKYLNKGNMEKALEQEETIRHNFMQINKYTDKWKARVKLDEKENYSETEKSKNYEKSADCSRCSK